MRGLIVFMTALVLGLALLTGGAWWVVSRTTSDWFKRDINLRSQLAVRGARQSIVAHWEDADGSMLRAILDEITRDERVLAVAACAVGGQIKVKTKEFPDEIDCAGLATHVARLDGTASWTSEADIRGGRVHISAMPLATDAAPFGFVVLLHDMSFTERRAKLTQSFLLWAFALLATSASVLTLAAARLAWSRWITELRRMVRGGAISPRFQPFIRDVRELVDRLGAESEVERQGRWSAARLKETLERELHGERVIIVANREPFIHQLTPGGAIEVLKPASGLVTALEPVLRACSGVWIAHGSGSADRLTADNQGRLKVPPGEESYVLRRLWLTAEEEKGYYYGFSNEGLWPLCHVAHTRPAFRSEEWQQYLAVNERFANAVCEEADTEDPVVLVQDYHFAIAPRLIRERLPLATIVTFWHIPWPSSESFGICPWREEILNGLLGSSILGFHTRYHCNNFLDAVDRFLESRIDRDDPGVVQQGRTTLVRAYPISVEWPFHEADSVPPPADCREKLLLDLGISRDAMVGVGVDRLDYTKGIEERLLAVEKLLDDHPDLVGKLAFVQIAAPSRTAIPAYQRLGEVVEATAQRINERFARGDQRPIHLLRRHFNRPDIIRLYRAADFCYVSSLHDGMNLVAKEFVASRIDGQGVLVLSQFTGAARELAEALIVNPYDIREASAALYAALTMPPGEQRVRMHGMRRYLAELNVYRWAGRMLQDAARLRRRDRIKGHSVRSLVKEA